MNKEKINSKIEDLEAELEQLKKLAQEPECTIQAGDVYTTNGGSYSYVLSKNHYTSISENGAVVVEMENCLHDSSWNCFTYLGKFNEVYVKISDVKEALSIKDCEGDSVLRDNTDELSLDMNTWEETRAALAKLGITAD